MNIVIVERSDAGGAPAERFRTDVQPLPDGSGLEMRVTVAAIAEPGQGRLEIGEEVGIDAGVGCQILTEVEVAGVAPEVTGTKQLQRALAADGDARPVIFVSGYIRPDVSLRALQLFLRKNSRLNRLPDYVIVEGPLAGGHLGFGMDWAKYDLRTITNEILDYLRAEQLAIPIIPAGGIFTGSDAVSYLEAGAAAVQVATRFTVTRECGLPENVKQEYFKAAEDEIEVNMISPTGYPMRMLKGSPAIGAGNRPNCEAYGYLLDGSGNCAYIAAYNREVLAHPEAKNVAVPDKTCLCTHMRNFDCWTCGHYTFRLKDTSTRLADGSYRLLTAEHVFQDYRYSTDGNISLPA